MANLFGAVDFSHLLRYLCVFQIVISQFVSFGSVAQVLTAGLGSQKNGTAAPPGARIIPLGSPIAVGKPLVDDHHVPPPSSPNLAVTLDKVRFNRIQQGPVGASLGSLAGLAGVANVVTPLPVATFRPPVGGAAAVPAASTIKPPPTTTFAGYLPGSPYPFVLPPPDIPYFGSKWNGPWGYPIGHYQAFRGTGQYITHYNYYPLSYFGSLMAPFAYGMSGKK